MQNSTRVNSHCLYARCSVGQWENKITLWCSPLPPRGPTGGEVADPVTRVEWATSRTRRGPGCPAVPAQSGQLFQDKLFLDGGRLWLCLLFNELHQHILSPGPLPLQGWTSASGILFSACSHGRAVGEFLPFFTVGKKKKEILQTHELPGISDN